MHVTWFSMQLANYVITYSKKLKTLENFVCEFFTAFTNCHNVIPLSFPRPSTGTTINGHCGLQLLTYW